jgi:hypothetical protein
MNFSNTSPTMTDVVEQFLPAYKERYALSPEQASVCQSILQCQTDILGGETWHCDGCGHEFSHYHSCGNRHCPRCKQHASEQWVAQQMNTVLPVIYYHLVFTLPHELNGWVQLHPEIIYTVLFQAASETLKQFSQHHRRLRGQLGMTCILHTWGQNLFRHVHLHCLIPGIALKPDQNGFEQTQSDYLYPLNALKKVFRGKMVSLLRERYQQGALHRISHKKEVKMILDTVMTKQWSIHIKPYLKKPETIVRYLSRYTYRIAISNQRILAVDEQGVTFRWKDYADHDQQKTMHLDGVEFLHRFLLHVLPKGYKRIRHYGFLANCVRKSKVALLRRLLAIKVHCAPEVVLDPSLSSARLNTIECPKCKKAAMRVVQIILPLKYRRRLMEPSTELI